MGKFFKKKSVKCDSCGKENIEVFKSVRKGISKFNYCQECYIKYEKEAKVKVKELMDEKARLKEKIKVKDTLQVVKDVSGQDLDVNALEKKPKEVRK